MNTAILLQLFVIGRVLNSNMCASLDFNVTRENLALNKTTKQSMDRWYNNYHWIGYYAVDGAKNFSTDCRCCSSAYYSSSYGTWWQVDLGSVYEIGKIDIYGRPDTSVEMGNFKVYAGINLNPQELIKTNNILDNKYKETGGLISITLGKKQIRYIRIENGALWNLTLCEVEVYAACEDNRFEPNCEECGHCDGSPCNKSTGDCPSGCQTGWKGSACNQTCVPGFYGKNCAEECRCRNQVECDRETGRCSDGLCNYMWTGEYCNSSTSIAVGKSVRMINQFDQTYNAKFAVDGNLTTDVDKCYCCSVTKSSYYPWFEVDLGRLYRISYITIYGRKDPSYGQSFQWLKMYAGQYNDSTKRSFYTNEQEIYFLNITLTVPVITQYVTLQFYYYQERIMTICELQLFEGACGNGTFGELCEHKCYCEGETCDGKTGICPSGQCLLGYRGANCSQECDNWTFGRGCTETCGFCVNGSVCNKFNGSCSSCSPGYLGVICKKECPVGQYGDRCLSLCENCLNGEPCHHVTGECVQGCQPGFRRPLCNETCQNGTYGIDCRETCGKCLGKEACNVANGHCSTEGCVDDFVPPLCSTSREELYRRKEESLPLSVGALGGIVSAGVVVLVAVVLIAVIVTRRRKPKQQEDENTEEIVLPGIQNSNADVLPRIQKSNADVLPRIQKSNTDTKANVVVVKPTIRGQAVEKTKSVPFSQEPMEYYAFAPRKEDVRIHQIWDYIHKGLQDDCSLFYAEFKSFQKGLQYECKAAKREDNKLKHRYKEIYAYDHNRVRLASKDMDEDLYINASFIDGYEKVAKFIASQGPTQDMVIDFYTMIWQQNCSIIVMLTNVFELGVLKCLQYWPFDDEVTFGMFTIRIQKEDIFPDYVIRHLEIIKDGEGTRVVKQYHFTSWPDKTIPQTVWGLVHFWRIVDKESKSNRQQSPILIHCSAGVGRTGTFIALDNLYHQAKSEGCIRPVQMVETLRRQRVNMIQTKTQYVFMHEAVAEALLFGTHYVNSSQFEDVFNFMSENQTDDGTVTNMEIQYEILERSLDDKLVASRDDSTTEVPISEDSVVELEAVYNNDDSTVMPNKSGVQADAVYGNVKETVQLNAKRKPSLQSNLFQDYKNEDSFLIVDEPTNDDTIQEFWNSVTASGAKTVVHIKVSDESMLNEQSIVNKEKRRNTCVFKEFSFRQLNRAGAPANMNIRLFEYSGWKEGENVISDQQSLLGLLTDIQLWQSTLSNMEPIVIVKNSSKQAGIMCVLLNELSRIKTLEQINILETVKKIKQKDKELVSPFEQYRFCYEMVFQSLHYDSVYQNC